MLLSRVAENLYWSSRHLERAEDTARIVHEHTNLLVDLPRRVALTWEPLLAIPGGRGEFDARYEKPDERSIITFLLADRENPSSVGMAVAQARDNLRSCREVLPREAWLVVNDLYLYLSSHWTDGVARRSRPRLLDRVISESQRVVGILSGTMRRDPAYEFLRLGRNVERADMTTRVLDVRAASLLAQAETDPNRVRFEEVQWTSVLRSLSALQMYRIASIGPVDGETTVQFLLADPLFPRSVLFCLSQVADAVHGLPKGAQVSTDAAAVIGHLRSSATGDHEATALRTLTDTLQAEVASIHDTIDRTWFHPSPAAGHHATGAQVASAAQH